MGIAIVVHAPPFPSNPFSVAHEAPYEKAPEFFPQPLMMGPTHAFQRVRTDDGILIDWGDTNEPPEQRIARAREGEQALFIANTGYELGTDDLSSLHVARDVMQDIIATGQLFALFRKSEAEKAQEISIKPSDSEHNLTRFNPALGIWQLLIATGRTDQTIEESLDHLLAIHFNQRSIESEPDLLLTEKVAIVGHFLGVGAVWKSLQY